MALDEKRFRAKYSEETDELRKQLTEKDRILKKYRAEHGVLENFFSEVREAISAVEPLKSVAVKPTSKSDTECVVCAQISDVHYGEVQQADEIEGFNEYSPKIAERRSLDYIKKLIEWSDLHRNAYKINDIHIIVTGDLISGDIHDELKITSEFPSPVQAVLAGGLLASQIYSIAPHFRTVKVHFIVEDNHARLTKKPQAKEAGMNSLNYVVGEVAKAYLKNHSNVEFNIYPMLEKVINVNNRQYLISHGHNVKGWMGIPWYGIHRHVSKEAMARMSLIMEDNNRSKLLGFHKYIIGHWHQPFNFQLYSGCGSVSGTSAYDHAAGRHADPSQSAWIVHPKHGEFDRIDFILK